MSVALTKTHNTMGVRTLGAAPPASMMPHSRRGGYVTLGASSDLVNALVAMGHPADEVQQLINMGATDEMLSAWLSGSVTDEQIIIALTGAGQVATPAENPINAQITPPAQDIGVLQSQANDLVSKVAQMNTDLNSLQQAAASAAASGNPISPQAGQSLMQQRNDLESIISQVTTVYRAAFGTTPPGLSGLGVDPATIAAAAALVAIILAAMAVWWQHEQNLKSQIAVQATQAQTQQQVASATTAQAQSLSRQADVYDQQGDLAAAQGDMNSATALHSKATQLRTQATDLLKQAGNAAGGTTTAQIGAFFQQNWPYFAIGAGALIVLPMLTGRRR